MAGTMAKWSRHLRNRYILILCIFIIAAIGFAGCQTPADSSSSGLLGNSNNLGLTQIPCSYEQGFSYEDDRQQPFGYITSLTIDGQAISTDIPLHDPLPAPTGSGRNSVGVLGAMNWSGGYSDPLQISGYISSANRQILIELLKNQKSKADVTFSIIMYAYDPMAKQYYQSLQSEPVLLKGNLRDMNNEDEFAIGDEIIQVVPDQQYYELTFFVYPTNNLQEIILKVSSKSTIRKTWGVTAG